MQMRRFMAVALLAVAANAFAHVGNHPSVHDTMAGIVQRLKQVKSPEELGSLTVPIVLDFLTDEERHILATQYLTFDVNVPVRVSVIHDVTLKNEPFWLKDEGFQKTEATVKVDDRVYDVWQKDFPAGNVGLGISSLSGAGEHYFVAVRPQDSSARLEITNIYPGQHTLGKMEVGASVYVDTTRLLTEVPEELKGQDMLRGSRERRRESQLINVFRVTPYPSSDRPDHVVLTWSGDPKTTQTIQWRTGPALAQGAVAYQKKKDYNSFVRREPAIAKAVSEKLETADVVNDPVVYRHTVTLTGLEPGTTYVYSVGDGTEGGWEELAEFTTAPDGIVPFSFIYMGDAQNGLDRWGTVVHNAFQSRPDAAFYVMAGDLVNRGGERDDWDRFFENAGGIFDRRQLVPVLGNHEYQNNDPSLYLKQFTLLENGPDTVGPERAYAFTYSNALFVVLDSNQPAESQAAWLEKVLSESDATWKFVTYHHPAYSSSPRRDNPEVRTVWGVLFDKYHVDLALQGHDHAYLRTFPMKGEQKVATPAEGTIYIVSNSGMKFYEQGQHDYTEVGLTNLSMYQVLDIQISGDRLVYKAYDIDGTLRDSFVIEK